MHKVHKVRLVVVSLIATSAMSFTAIANGVSAELRSSAALQPRPGAGEALPTAPAGAQVIGGTVWTCDALQGLAHTVPLTQGVPDPVLAIATTGNLHLPISPTTTPATCGQLAYDGDGKLYVTQGVVDAKVTPSTSRGVLRVTVDPTTGAALDGGTYIAMTAGLDGNQPTAAAIGPDGNLYVAFLKSGNIKRIVNSGVGTTQTVQSVGSTPSGHPGRSLAFVGSALFIGSVDALSVIPSATSSGCTGGCNAVTIVDGFSGQAHEAVASDSVDSVYFAVSNQVWRYSLSTGTFAFVSQGGAAKDGSNPSSFSFVTGKSNLLTLDSSGNLLIGDDTSNATTTGAGRLWSISQATLASITGGASVAGTNVAAIQAVLRGPWESLIGNIVFVPTFNANGTFSASIEPNGLPITTDSGTWTLTPPQVVQPLGNPQAHLRLVDAAGKVILEGDCLQFNADQIAIQPATETLTDGFPLQIGDVILTKFAP